MTEHSANYSYYYAINEGQMLRRPLSTPPPKVQWKCMGMMQITNMMCSSAIMYGTAYTSKMGFVFLGKKKMLKIKAGGKMTNCYDIIHQNVCLPCRN